MKLAVICNPAKVADDEALRIEVKRRWPDAALLWLETTVDDPGAGQARAALARWADRRLDSSPRMLTMRGRTVSVRAAQDVPVEFDGDYAGEIRQSTVTVPGAVELCPR